MGMPLRQQSVQYGQIERQSIWLTMVMTTSVDGQNLKELRGLQGGLAYIRRFIANLSGRFQLFTRLMKKGVSFVWDQACQEAYKDIKRYLTKPPVIVAPTLGKSSLLYVKAMDHSLGTLLAQKDDNITNKLFII